MEAKRRRIENDTKLESERKALIYIIPQKIQKRRLEILQNNSKLKGLPVTDSFR